MRNITQTHLEAAIIDQEVAGIFGRISKRWCYVAVMRGDGEWGLGVAVEDEQGYHPIDGKTFPTRAEASEWANGLNDHVGLSETESTAIIVSSMRLTGR